MDILDRSQATLVNLAKKGALNVFPETNVLNAQEDLKFQEENAKKSVEMGSNSESSAMMETTKTEMGAQLTALLKVVINVMEVHSLHPMFARRFIRKGMKKLKKKTKLT